MLGSDLLSALRRRFPSRPILAPTRRELDVTDSDSVHAFVRASRPAIVVNASAFTAVDAAESDRAAARALNGLGPAHLASACRETGARLVHFGTDQVFDGSGERPWTERDLPSPANHYAETKLEGEKAALESDSALVLRVQWLYGAKKDRFTGPLAQERFTPFSDQFGAPTWTCDVAEMTADALERGLTGLYHLAYDDWASWAEVYAFARELLGSRTRLEPLLTSAIPLPARRPLNSRLSNQKLRAALGRTGLGSWRDRLRAFLLESPPRSASGDH